MAGAVSGPKSEIIRFVVCFHGINDPRSAGYLVDCHALGINHVKQILCQDLFFIEGRLDEAEIERLGTHLLSDPLTQSFSWNHVQKNVRQPGNAQSGDRLIEVALRPGVTDPVAEQIVRASKELGIPGVERASTGLRFLVSGSGLDDSTCHALAARLLANPIIHRYELGAIEPIFPAAAKGSTVVERFPIRELDEPGLMALSMERRAALDLEEMQAIQQMYRTEMRDMTDIEFETIAQTWSEHCVHKTFKAQITIQNPGDGYLSTGTQPVVINNLLKTYLREATETINARWVRSAFVDNAGIIDFDEEYEVSFKVETHNHPSAIEPFGGANTGVGGVIRDVIGVSAKPIAATDVLCFGPARAKLEDLPVGVLHPRRIRSGVVAGVQDYGNKIGLPTVSGAILYDPGFIANPLVFCGCVGIAPKGSHRRDPQVNDRVIVLGGRTGRDGLRGATFSSMTMDAQTGEVSGASVQIGAPIVEKGLIDIIVLARDAQLYTAITDCGAGGLSSAVGEMASQIGAELDLRQVRLKYPGLAPWEIWLSEAQERMVLAVPEENLAPLQALCNTYDVELTDIGVFTGSGRLVVRYGEMVVLDLANEFLHEGIPQRRLTAVLPEKQADLPGAVARPIDLNQALLDLLAHPNIASKAAVIRIYDHEVQGGTVIKPLTGVQNDGPSDAVVLKPAGTAGATAIVLGAGINPEYGKIDAYAMAISVIDEAIRNAVAVGADPRRIALLDNFCWGDPKNPASMGTLVEAARACRDAAMFYQTPFISGKDSLNNEYTGTDGQRHAIPPTLLISSIGVVSDLGCSVSMDLKTPGDLVYLVGDFKPHLGGSHLALVMEEAVQGNPPGLPARAPDVYAALHQAIQERLVRACHDLSEGGLAVAAAEMCIGGRLGLEVEVGPGNPALELFGETNGCLLVEVAPETEGQFAAKFSALPARKVGRVAEDHGLIFQQNSQVLIASDLNQLVAAWQQED